MITWWDCPTYSLFYFMSILSVSLESLLDPVQHISTPHQPDRTKLLIIFIRFFPLSILVISSFTNPGSSDQGPTSLVFTIHNFSECVNGIFIFVTGDDIIHEYSILDTIYQLKIKNVHEFIKNIDLYYLHLECDLKMIDQR